MLMVINSFVAIILNSFHCLSLKRFTYVQVKESLAFVLCITLELIKNRVLLIKC